MEEYNLEVTPTEAGMRLDLYILNFCQINRLGLSRNTIQKLIQQGYVVSKDKKINAHYKIKADEVFLLRIPVRPSLKIEPENICLDIRFEDEDVLVVNKPQGMVVHPGAGNYKGTLVNALLFHCKSLSSVNPQRPGIVHRLDKDTSGLMVVAKNNLSHYHLSGQFSKHSVLRQYVALVKGKVQFDEDSIELPIGRHPRQRQKMGVSFISKHKYAKTKYRVLKRSSKVTLLELTPFTGRTHQLRVHLSFIGHPILGDKKYGEAFKSNRLALHAYRIGFTHPKNNKFIEIKTDIPKEFLQLFKEGDFA